MDKKAFRTSKVVRWSANATLRQSSKVSIGLTRAAFIISLWVIVAMLSACSGATTATATSIPQAAAASSTPQPTATPNPTDTPNPTATPADTSTPQQTARPTALDPCQLITSQEASALAGASFGAGKEGTTPGGLKTCTYGSQGANVFTVDVIQAPDTASADAGETQFLNDLQASLAQLTSEGLQITKLPNYADGAVTAHANISAGGITLNGSAFAFRKGTIFFGFSDVVIGGAAAPSDTAMQSQADTVLARLP